MEITLKHSLSHHLIDPVRGRFPKGTLWVFKSNKSAFLALSDGRLLNLADLLDGKLEREADLKAEITRLTQRTAELLDENRTLKNRNRG